MNGANHAAAQPASADDQPFRHYSLKHRCIAWVSQHVFDRITYTVRHGLLRGMKRKGGMGWLPEWIAAEQPSPEHLFWRELDVRDQVVYDIGGFEGLLTLHFARQARTVVTYEPNARNNSRLIENVRLNSLENVIVRKLGVGSENRAAKMVSDPRTPGGASLDGAAVERQASVPVVSEDISVVRLDDDIRNASLPAPGFIKIDIEGWELAALTGARDTILAHRPRLFLEMHGETMALKRKKAWEIVEYLTGTLGYTDIRHVESGQQVSPATPDIAARGHLYCVPGA